MTATSSPTIYFEWTRMLGEHSLADPANRDDRGGRIDRWVQCRKNLCRTGSTKDGRDLAEVMYYARSDYQKRRSQQFSLASSSDYLFGCDRPGT